MVLPSTYEVSGELSYITTQPIAFGGFCDVYEGYLGQQHVCIKRLRISGNRELVKRVCHPHYPWSEYHVLTGSGVVLEGSCSVETPRSSEHRALQGCHL